MARLESRLSFTWKDKMKKKNTADFKIENDEEIIEVYFDENNYEISA